MSSSLASPSHDEYAAFLAVEVLVDEEFIRVRLTDGRWLAVPIAWYPSLFNASAEQRGNFELLADGIAVHWPDLDEDISIRGMMRGWRPQ